MAGEITAQSWVGHLFGLEIYTRKIVSLAYLIDGAIIVWYKFWLPFVMVFVLGSSMALMPVLVVIFVAPHYNKRSVET